MCLPYCNCNSKRVFCLPFSRILVKTDQHISVSQRPSLFRRQKDLSGFHFCHSKPP